MELGAEISQKIKKTIKKKLQAIGQYVDDELPEYIMVMIANKRTHEQVVDDLNLFLGEEATGFTKWLFTILRKLQKAMEKLVEESSLQSTVLRKSTAFRHTALATG